MNFPKRICSLALTIILILSCLAVPAFAAESNIVYGIGFVTASALRLRSDASTASAIVATAQKNECVVVLEKSGEWYKVNYNLQQGYMHQSYLTVRTAENAELGYGSVTAAYAVNMRSGPSTSYPSIGYAHNGEKCYIIGINNGWYKVIFNGKIGYIRSDYLALTEIPYENQGSANSPKFFRLGKSTGIAPSAAALGSTDTAVSGTQILAETRKYLGAPYINGGASPSGFDCSGLVYYVLKNLGFSPYRTAAEQYTMGKAVKKVDLAPGDLVFFAGTVGTGISHVGIYAGNGQFIHAPNSRTTVSYSDLTTGYWAEHYFGARRMTQA